MIDPLRSLGVNPLQPPVGGAAGADSGSHGEFASLIRQQIEKASAMQNDADASLQKLLTGESANMTEVFTTARKAQVAFSLMMEIRNKLVDAYEELKNLRV